ncbi:MAG: UDP-2,3-diacylglucosamine diphosphatase LpxI [Proteobacteria bacterium]|nr:UDP-2,3-diacylglucosamine diphosphatase LpxI [Pseudomonadota bacterium]
MERLGLIAGNGNFPLLFAREASSRGCAVTAVAHRDETDPALAALVDDLSWIRVGQVGRMINCFKQAGVSRAVMVGGINKVRSLASLRPDWRGLRLIAGAAGRGDDALLRALAAELEGEGIEVVSSTLFLDRLLVEAGHVTGPLPSPELLADIRVGCKVLAALGELDVGQSVVVEDGVVLAVEAIEGTDAAARRAGELGRGRAVLVKGTKRGQDLRFDLPAAGTRTIEVMKESGVAALALRAGSTIIVDDEGFAEAARTAGVSVLGWTGDGEVPGIG